MSKNKNARRTAYQKKQEQQGKNVVMWIISVLIVLGILFMCWISFSS